MISFSEADIMALVSPVFWPFLRVLAVFSSAPIFSARSVPMRSRVALAMLVAICAQPGLPDQPVIGLADSQAFGVVLQQVVIGIAIGLAVRIVFASVELALERSKGLLVQHREEKALRGRYALLSQRERQVMSLVVTGLLNKQIGGELGISEITVKAHRGKVMRKMNVRTLVALVNSAGRLKLEPYTGQGRMKQVQSASPAASSSISALAWRRSDVSNPSMNRP